MVFFSESFLLERGVRQGDLLSPHLFVTAVEILAIVIRSDTNIGGIKVGDGETKVLAYADDMLPLCLISHICQEITCCSLMPSREVLGWKWI